MKALFFVFFCNLVFADHTVYKQIVNNEPDIDKSKAKKIAYHISVVNIKYKIPKNIYAAILMQESRYKLNAINRETDDYCMAQINIKTVNAFKFDKEKLLINMEYCIEAGAIVLADFQRMYGQKEPTWFTRYNSSNPRKRRKYFAKISRWMPESKVSYEKK